MDVGANLANRRWNIKQISVNVSELGEQLVKAWTGPVNVGELGGVISQVQVVEHVYVFACGALHGSFAFNFSTLTYRVLVNNMQNMEPG